LKNTPFTKSTHILPMLPTMWLPAPKIHFKSLHTSQMSVQQVTLSK